MTHLSVTALDHSVGGAKKLSAREIVTWPGGPQAAPRHSCFLSCFPVSVTSRAWEFLEIILSVPYPCPGNTFPRRLAQQDEPPPPGDLVIGSSLRVPTANTGTRSRQRPNWSPPQPCWIPAGRCRDEEKQGSVEGGPFSFPDATGRVGWH